jgi:succinate dehydrogenase/fumarate reductase-like Fe-S protein
LQKLSDPFSVMSCHTIMNCTKTCPKVITIITSLTYKMSFSIAT